LNSDPLDLGLAEKTDMYLRSHALSSLLSHRYNSKAIAITWRT